MCDIPYVYHTKRGSFGIGDQTTAYHQGFVKPHHSVPATLYTAWLSKLWDMPSRNVYGAAYYEFVVSHLSLYR